MALKYLLCAFTTSRKVDGEDKPVRVRFKAKSVVELNDDEIELLDRLTQQTGKIHYRDPVSEGGAKVVASEPEVIETKDYAGQDVAMTDKTADQLKAYLTFFGVEHKGNASKADLLALAQKHEAGELTPADDDL